MPETINLKFIAAPLTSNQLKGIHSDSAAAEIVGRKVQICCTGVLRARFGAAVSALHPYPHRRFAS
jgi:hypothetical protein